MPAHPDLLHKALASWQRLLALLLAACLTYPPSAGAAASTHGPLPITEGRSAHRTIPIAYPRTLTIPESLGGILEVYDPNQPVAPQGIRHTIDLTTPPAVIHIQDLHTHPEAQLHIASLLELLHQQLGVDLVALEGGEGRCQTPPAAPLLGP